jgi:predicted enzyme related to lactoylglutathione lyase
MVVESYVDGTPSWVDLMTTDQDGAISFYADLLGWQAMKGGDEVMSYAMCTRQGQPVAGIGQIPDGSPFPAAWTTYISVSDADTVAAAAVEAGGQVMAPVMNVAEGATRMGRMAVIADPSGGVFGIWEPDQHLGAGLVNDDGALTWNELRTTALDASKDFLGAVFGYRFLAQDVGPGKDYYMIQVDGKDVGGVMTVPAAMEGTVPSHWMTYFAVADTDDTVARAVVGGATLLSEIADTPNGRMAMLADPQGAAFSVIERAAA